MRARRLNKATTVLSVLLLALAACESEPQQSGNSRRSSRSRGGVKELIDKDTDSLSKVTDWASAQKLYDQIKVDIERHVRSERVKDDMYGLLDKAYCHSMDTIMHGILNGTCESNHKLLREIHAARVKGDFASIATNLHSDVEQKFKTHEEMVSFISKTKANRQSVSSYTLSYEESYEKTQKATASNYLKQDVRCSEIKNGLQSITDGRAFRARRQAFCDKVIQLYIDAGVYSPREYKEVSAKIRSFSDFFNKQGEPLTNEARVWIENLEAFKEANENN